MAQIQIGCQTYTWQMSGEKYIGKLPHIMGIANKAGFAGVEPEVQFLGELYDPQVMAAELNNNDIEFAAVCLVEDWLNPQETEQEKANADKTIEFLKEFPETMLALCQMPGESRDHLEQKQDNLLSCANEIAKRATDQGLKCGYHPNSPASSIFRTAEDYGVLLNGLGPELGWIPDVGHIAKGGMDPLGMMKEFRDLINHVHYKDMNTDGTWAAMGEGSIDFIGITQFLADTDYSGWIIVEDECDAAIPDPDGITMQDGVYIEQKLKPIVA